MFDHVTIRVSDRAATEPAYRAVLGALGHASTHSGDAFAEWDDFSLAQATAERPPTRGLHIGFAAPTPAHLTAAWRAGLAAGLADDGAPDPRPAYGPDYVGAFLRDRDGNSVEGAFHDGVRRRGVVDHLWVRVSDLAASRRLYAALAPAAGLRVVADEPGLLRLAARAGDGNLTLVEGPPTANLHVAFPAADPAAVDRFHAAALAAGFRDDGPPGERPQYHPGYYGAFVLDPDGTSLELVHHGRAG